MAFTKNKLNELSKEELVEELLRFDNLSAKKIIRQKNGQFHYKI